ncbi:MAG TPA: hypothetical protein VK449_01170, partial [Anaerolineales bacterium]|nr:hypothetical protein [Anaerolineales bacterium]
MTPERFRSIDWTRFEVQEADLEVVYNLLLEREAPLTAEEMAPAVVERRLAAQRQAEARAAEAAAETYLPGSTYAIGTRLSFPALADAVGQVAAERDGLNPDLGAFRVIQVRFDDGGLREFAAGLADHKLNAVTPATENDGKEDAVEAILTRHGR